MSQIDYGAIAVITIFTSIFTTIGQKLVNVLADYIKKWHSKIKKETS